jgi:Zn-dependent peptidase ImmA (M78 family)
MRWARVTIGLSISDVATRLKRSQDVIASWEDGSAAPTYPQLEKLAYEVYKRPMAIFFFPQPPVEMVPTKEFRTLPDADMQTLYPDTYLQIRYARAFQKTIEELFAGKNPSDHCIWKLASLSMDASIDGQARRTHEILGIDLAHQLSWKDDESALRHWRTAIEDAGVFVFKASFKQKDISGFSLLGNDFPIIYLNNSTTKTRQIFSLFHELAHLLLHVNGIAKFDTSYVREVSVDTGDIEVFCNRFAAEFLIPMTDFKQQVTNIPHDVASVPDSQFSKLAARYGVSREAILRRFADLGRVDPVFYRKMSTQWISQKKKPTRGHWYATQGAYLSPSFATEVIGRYYRQQLSVEQAADLLGIKARNFTGLEQRIVQRVME